MPTFLFEGVDATIAFGDSTHTANLHEFTFGAKTRAAMETSHLGIAESMTFKPSKHIDEGEWQCLFDWDPNMDELIRADVQTVTITLPLGPGESSPGTVAASVFATSEGDQVLKAGETAKKSVTFKITGAVTVTPGS